MLRTGARVLAAAAVCLGLLTGGGGIAAAGTPGAGAAAARCTGTVRITSFAFNPARVLPGQSSAAVLTLKNCTTASQTVSETWYGRFSGAGTGIPAGCPAVDPFPRSVTLAPLARATTSTGYTVPASCTATQLAVTVSITGPTLTTPLQQTAVLQIG